MSDAEWLAHAIGLSRRCPPSLTAYSVGAVLVDAVGNAIASGYSREGGPHVHAEESVLAKVGRGDRRLGAATLYSSLEPCTQRSSGPWSCTELIIAAGVSRVVIAWREPSLFVPDCRGVETLTAAGVVVIELSELAAEARAVNSHLRLA